MNDDEFVKNKLAYNPLWRHLFAKRGQIVRAVFDNKKVEGELKTIDVGGMILEVGKDKVYYVNMKKEWYLETPKTVLPAGGSE